MLGWRFLRCRSFRPSLNKIHLSNLLNASTRLYCSQEFGRAPTLESLGLGISRVERDLNIVSDAPIPPGAACSELLWEIGVSGVRAKTVFSARRGRAEVYGVQFMHNGARRNRTY